MRTPPDLTDYVDLASGDGPQVFAPALTFDGDLHLQPGERIVASFDTIGAGIRSGLSPVRHAGGSMEQMRGRCVVTNTRAVFVCHRWEIGGDLYSARRVCARPPGTTMVRTRPGRQPHSAGRVLVGQVRWPWLVSVSFARGAGCIDSLVELRCVQPGDARVTSVFLSMVPAPGVDVDRVVGTIVDTVRDDRLGHLDGRGDKALRLGALAVPAASSRWNTVDLPGAYKRMASTAVRGEHSGATLSTWRYRLVDRIYA